MIDVLDCATRATPAWVAEVMRPSFGEATGDLVAVDREPLGNGAGFFGDLTRLRLEYDGTHDGAPRSLILKLPSSSESNRTRGNLFALPEREVRFYRELAPSLHVGVPRCYWSRLDSPSGSWGLLLEDLGTAPIGDELLGLGPRRLKAAVVSAARMHAQWWGAPDLDDLDWLPAGNGPVMRQLGAIYRESWPAFVDRHGGSLPRDAVALGVRVGDHLGDVLDCVARAPATLVHGDYRTDNLFASESPDVIAVIDWQLCLHGCGVFDVAYLLGQSATVAVRRRYEFHMLRHWYDALLDAGVTGYSFRDAVNDYRRCLLVCIGYAVAGTTLDRGNDRGRALSRAQAVRAFTAAVDLQAESLLGA